MVAVFIDGISIEVPAGSTVIQACEKAGVEIPRFCYHERLKIAGNCRMCLVEIEGGPPKPAASCAMPVAENMKVHTNTPMVKKAREGVMEFLLINHPLDCPICDQGGECDLQDQAVAYGSGVSRYREGKRAVKDKYMGPLIKTHMTRCIHCTRCVRFMDEIAGVPELGATGRGEHMEVGTYIEQALTSELSGNIVDLCPVGALTSRPYAFRARSWELRHTASIDVLDAVGSNIRVDSRGMEVMRILPRLHDDINEEWISDKTRYACDGLKLQRLDRPMVRDEQGKLQPASWDEAFAAIRKRLSGVPGEQIAAIAGDLADAESMMALKDLMERLGSPHLDCRQDGAKIDTSMSVAYLFNTGIAGIEQADLCLLVGTNPRFEAPLINARLRKRYLRGGFDVLSVGETLDLTFPVEDLGRNPSLLQEISVGKGPLAKRLNESKFPMLIVGQDALKRDDAPQILHHLRLIAERFGMVREDWRGYNMLHKAAARVAGLDLGFVPGAQGRDVTQILSGSRKDELQVVYLLGADEIDMSQLGHAFVIYQGHHGDAGAHRADVILPGCAYTEKNATYVNTEGRVQRTSLAVQAPGEAREDWKILRALSAVLGFPLPYDTLEQLRARIEQIAPHFAKTGDILPAEWGVFGIPGDITSTSLSSSLKNFYMTDPISRASKTMAACTNELWLPHHQQQKAA